MSDATQGTYYRPSPVVLTGKAILSGVRRVMPSSLYAGFYRRVDRAYRRSVHLGYSRFWLRERVAGSAEGRERAAAVWRVMPYSLVGWKGLEATYDAVTSINRERLPGAMVECGVAQGGCAALMATTDARQGGKRRIILCDSYEGLPDPTAEDYEDGKTGTHASDLVRGSCLGTEGEVAALLFGRFKVDHTRVRLVKGWFQNTLPALSREVGAVALLRIDADWYESVKCCLQTLYDRVVPGGVVIIDDYGSCHGAKRAVDEFLRSRKIDVKMQHDGRGGCTFRKPR
jgi:O-methyltransferase